MANKITYLGSDKEIRRAVDVLKKHKKLTRMAECEARLLVQQLIDEHHLKASILINGNSVWSKQRIMANLERIMKYETLYNLQQEKPPILSQYFYQFLIMVCGSINHYDIHGWIHKYPTVEHLKKFFMENEFGKRVVEWIPASHTDARLIAEDITKKLFPFKTYMKTRKTE